MESLGGYRRVDFRKRLSRTWRPARYLQNWGWERLAGVEGKRLPSGGGGLLVTKVAN